MKFEIKTGPIPPVRSGAKKNDGLAEAVRSLQPGQYLEITDQDKTGLKSTRSRIGSLVPAGMKISTRLVDGALCVYRSDDGSVSAPATPNAGPIMDAFRAIRPSQHPNPAKHAQTLMRRAGINVDVQYRSKGWYGLVENGGHTQLVRGAKKLDDVTEAAIRIKSQEQDAA